jgi:hypothetical protein
LGKCATEDFEEPVSRAIANFLNECERFPAALDLFILDVVSHPSDLEANVENDTENAKRALLFFLLGSLVETTWEQKPELEQVIKIQQITLDDDRVEHELEYYNYTGSVTVNYLDQNQVVPKSYRVRCAVTYTPDQNERLKIATSIDRP